MGVNLSDFESDLLRLCIIWIRAMTIYKEYPKHMIKNEHELMVRHLFREVTVEQLHNFIKIRKDLLTNQEFKKLDDIVKPLVEPILQYEEPIKKLRNQYVAHIQEESRKFELMMNDIILEYSFPTSFSYYRYMTGLVFFYCGIIERNFKTEWDKAMKKYNAKSGIGISITSGFKMKDVERKITDILSPMQIPLHDNGYVTSVSKEIIEKLRKKYSTS